MAVLSQASNLIPSWPDDNGTAQQLDKRMVLIWIPLQHDLQLHPKGLVHADRLG